MKIIAKVRYIDFQKRTHYVEVESDNADRRHLEDLLKADTQQIRFIFNQ